MRHHRVAQIVGSVISENPSLALNNGQVSDVLYVNLHGILPEPEYELGNARTLPNAATFVFLQKS